MPNAPRKVSNSSPCFRLPSAAVRWEDVGGGSSSSSFVRGSPLRGRQPRLCGETCLAKLEATSKIALTPVGERACRPFSPACLLGAFDSTLLPSLSSCLSHSPFAGCLVRLCHTASGERKSFKTVVEKAEK